jgi:hypothetical protein
MISRRVNPFILFITKALSLKRVVTTPHVYYTSWTVAFSVGVTVYLLNSIPDGLRNETPFGFGFYRGIAPIVDERHRGGIPDAHSLHLSRVSSATKPISMRADIAFADHAS